LNDKSVIGVVLAGGRSLRMGTNKALLKLDGKPIIEHVTSTMQAVFDRVILVTNEPSTYRSLGLEMFGDLYKDRGPLGGIHSALVHADGADVFVSACDTPFISRELVKYVVEYPSANAVKIPSSGEHLHPLCGLYTQSCLEMVVQQLEARNYRVLDLFEKIPTAIIPISPALPFYREDLFANFNYPEDSIGKPNDQEQ
jgi:molybdopterin-guanine dinucleotide biosynthesis protein A